LSQTRITSCSLMLSQIMLCFIPFLYPGIMQKKDQLCFPWVAQQELNAACI
jgi:hypothetical protein